MDDELQRGILVIDYGSQTTLLIARRLREIGVYAEIWSCHDSRLALPPPALGIILSGGPASVCGETAPRLAESVIACGRPVLGICYGMQLVVERLGGTVAPGAATEYGRVRVRQVDPGAALFASRPADGSVVWMSHGDAAVTVPEPLAVTARTENGAVAAVEARGRPLFGVQFHPEVTHTEHGREWLRRFACDLCGAADAWSAANLIDEKVAAIAAAVGDDRAILAFSGGVDSTVAAALGSRAIGRRLVCILVDNGLLRHGEADQVRRCFLDRFDVELRVVEAQQRFLDALAGVGDPEAKRKAIGKTFIDVFEQEARRVEGARFLVQGTLYPDVIESVSVRGPAAAIKSHHNVGGLPGQLPFALIEPLRNLFKDEVRQLGRSLGIPEALLGRHPFPGPGLAVRILGEVTADKLAIARAADRIFIEMLREHGLYDQVWQALAVLLPVRTVGVMGDARTYDAVVALRAVTSLDGMTADRAGLPIAFLGAVADRIVNGVKGVSRVVYDLTSKPPATIEWE
ncbi:MAG: glutamine-hydrolyzing GMP synthase [Deltaproteobacteria bacterium]|nr:glutamine-hydrolyzing GMP synthase [Deltaproteobacteria bacterium]